MSLQPRPQSLERENCNWEDVFCIYYRLRPPRSGRDPTG